MPQMVSGENAVLTLDSIDYYLRIKLFQFSQSYLSLLNASKAQSVAHTLKLPVLLRLDYCIYNVLIKFVNKFLHVNVRLF
jgi:hypothetical protein